MGDDDFIKNMNVASGYTVGLQNIINPKKTDYGYQYKIVQATCFLVSKERDPDLVDKSPSKYLINE